jgi:hypothetical protein
VQLWAGILRFLEVKKHHYLRSSWTVPQKQARRALLGESASGHGSVLANNPMGIVWLLLRNMYVQHKRDEFSMGS